MRLKYVLNAGTQVRRESFGLLFYTMAGPRLYFLPSKDILEEDFFQGTHTLERWVSHQKLDSKVNPKTLSNLEKALNQLRDKGVINGV